MVARVQILLLYSPAPFNHSFVMLEDVELSKVFLFSAIVSNGTICAVLEMPQSSSKRTSALQIFSRYAAISTPLIGAGVVIGWSLEIGVAIMVMAATITLIVLFWLNARSLDREAERTQVAEARRESEAHTRAVLNSALDSIISMDHEGKVIEFNPAAEKTFGYSRQEGMGRLLVDLIIPHSLRERHRQGFAHYLATGKGTVLDRRIEITAMRSDGSEFPVELAITRIPGDGPPMFTGYIRDLTAQKAQEEFARRSRELEEQNLRIQEANRLKSEFLANMSHELRTPLNGVIGFTEYMVDEKAGPINAQQREYLTDVLTSAKHLLQRINDVLDLAKIEAGKMELKVQAFSVRQEIDEVITIIRPMAVKKRLDLSMEAPDGSVTVTLDPLKFKQILYNLLSNAVKFTPENGQVSLAVTLKDHQVRLNVADTGIGIKVEDLQRLFHEFEQLESGLGRQQQGTGLGLALTKRIVELQGGSIAVESEFGKGSMFTVVLPTTAETSN